VCRVFSIPCLILHTKKKGAFTAPSRLTAPDGSARVSLGHSRDYQQSFQMCSFSKLWPILFVCSVTAMSSAQRMPSRSSVPHALHPSRD